MNSSILWPLWRDAALGSAGLILLAWGLDRWARTAVGRQSIWQACFLGLALLMGLELTGLRQGLSMAVSRAWAGGALRSLWTKPPGQPLMIAESERALIMRGASAGGPSPGHAEGVVDQGSAPLGETPLILTELTEKQIRLTGSHPLSPETLPESGQFHHASSPSSLGPAPLWPPTGVDLLSSPARFSTFDAWLLIFWAGGAALVGLRMAASFIWTVWLRRHSHEETSPAIRVAIEQLASQVSVSPPKRILTSPKLGSPLHFGLLRPAILLPAHFEKRFNENQQRAMLAHELAHVARRDLCWMALSECVLATLWWHPLVWLACRRLRQRSEAVADEASLLLPGGPTALAECLLHFGNRIAAGPVPRWAGLGAQGFRSGLGQRVEQLLKLASTPHPCAIRKRFAGARVAITLVMLAGSVMGLAWPIQTSSLKGDPMNLIQQSWKRSAAAALVAMAVGTSQPGGLPAAEPADAPAGQNPPASVEQAPPIEPDTAPLSHDEIQEALRSVIIEQVTLKSASLPDIFKTLNGEVRQKSARQAPINFAISRQPPGASDDSTQATLRPDPNQAVIDVPALRQVTLRDLLDIIVLSADQPLAWRVEEEGIVFSPPGRESPSASAPYAGMPPELLKRYGIIPPATRPATPSGMSPETLKRYGITPGASTSATNSAGDDMPAGMARRYGLDPVLARRYGLTSPPPTAVTNNRGETTPPEPPYQYRGMSPEQLKRYGLFARVNEPVIPSGAGNTDPQREAARSRVRRHLLNTTLDMVEAENAPLADFLQALGEEVKRQHPDMVAPNFVLSKKSSTMEVIPDSVLANATVTLKPGLRRARLQDVITTIPTVSSIPLKVTIEPYGVLFTPSLPAAASAKPAPQNPPAPADRPAPIPPPKSAKDFREPQMTAKAFQLRHDFLRGLQHTFGLNIPEITLTTDAEKKIKQALPSLAERLGVGRLDPDQQIFYNQIASTLMIRAPERDLIVLEAAILTAGAISLGNNQP